MPNARKQIAEPRQPAIETKQLTPVAAVFQHNKTNHSGERRNTNLN